MGSLFAMQHLDIKLTPKDIAYRELCPQRDLGLKARQRKHGGPGRNAGHRRRWACIHRSCLYAAADGLFDTRRCLRVYGYQSNSHTRRHRGARSLRRYLGRPLNGAVIPPSLGTYGPPLAYTAWTYTSNGFYTSIGCVAPNGQVLTSG